MDKRRSKGRAVQSGLPTLALTLREEEEEEEDNDGGGDEKLFMLQGFEI